MATAPILTRDQKIKIAVKEASTLAVLLTEAEKVFAAPSVTVISGVISAVVAPVTMTIGEAALSAAQELLKTGNPQIDEQLATLTEQADSLSTLTARLPNDSPWGAVVSKLLAISNQTTKTIAALTAV